MEENKAEERTKKSDALSDSNDDDASDPVDDLKAEVEEAFGGRARRLEASKAKAKPEDDEHEEEKKPAKKTSLDKKPVPSASPVVDARARDVRAGLITAVIGYLLFWGTLTIYQESVAQKLVNYFSHVAWLFVAAYFLITAAAFQLIRYEPVSERAKVGKPKLERNGLTLGVAVFAPVYALYWWKASQIWGAMYPSMWWLFGLFFAGVTLGVLKGFMPPTAEDEKAQRIPGRRIILLTMLPFGLVYGMIWLASLYPPWPS